MKVRTRIAPSPTGPQMHIGNFRTALYSYFWAKKNKGEFILRVEDTDRKRYVKGSVEGYMELFRTFNLTVDKFPTEEAIAQMDNVNYPTQDWILNEEFYESIEDESFKEVFIQTQRLPLYLKYALELVKSGFAYLCFLTEEELAEEKEKIPQFQPFRSPHRFLSKEDVDSLIKQGKPYVIRLHVENYIKNRGISIVDYEDLVLGKMKFDLNTVDDQVLIKSNGIPTYHLAVVVDDHNMEITHPIRGYGWLPSTPKQIMLYDMLGWEMKPFAHVTDVLDPAGGKLSKRKGAVFTTEFIKQGYLTEAIINFIVLVGWTPKIERSFGEKEREIFSLEELIDLFSIEGISKTNAIFDRTKLVWFNQQYIKMKASDELARVFVNWLQKYADDESLKLQALSLDGKSLKNQIIADKTLSMKIKLVQERSKTLVEILESIEFFYLPPESVSWEIDQVKDFRDKIQEIRKEIIALHENLSENTADWDNDTWATMMKEVSAKHSLKPGDSFMVLRMYVVGAPFSPPLFECLQILGKEEVLRRLKAKS